MSKWTPGPWDTANDGRDVISASTGYIVCETSGNEDDARLIAAAPEMARLLYLFTEASDDFDANQISAAQWADRVEEYMVSARALLAKVNG